MPTFIVGAAAGVLLALIGLLVLDTNHVSTALGNAGAAVHLQEH